MAAALLLILGTLVALLAARGRRSPTLVPVPVRTGTGRNQNRGRRV